MKYARTLALSAAAALCALPAFERALDWMLRAAGAEDRGLALMARRHALAVVYVLTLRIWINDDSADQGKTMAALDRALKQAESVLTLTPARGWGEAKPQGVAPKRQRRKPAAER